MQSEVLAIMSVKLLIKKLVRILIVLQDRGVLVLARIFIFLLVEVWCCVLDLNHNKRKAFNKKKKIITTKKM